MHPPPAWARLGCVAGAVALLAGCGGGDSTTSLASTASSTTAPPSPGSSPAPSTTAVHRIPSRAPRATSTTRKPTVATPSSTTSVAPAPAPGHLRPRGTYTDWNWPPPPTPSQYTAQDLNLTVLTDPGPTTPYFFAHQFGFDKGAGGYVGLQTRATVGPAPGAPLGKIALFSVFAGCDDHAATSECPSPLPIIGASAQPGLLNGSSCSPLTSAGGSAPEGPGASCRVPFEWREGVTYGLQVVLAAPHVWQANVVDGGTGAVTVVGQIRVPDSWGGLSTFSVSWIEYYGDTTVLKACSDIPLARIRWDGAAGVRTFPGGLLGIGSSTLVAPPASLNNHLTPGPALCSNSSITDSSPRGSGVVQAMGGP
jgi:hypothetical protein